MIRAIIADDERLARVGLRRHLDGFPDLAVVAECGDGGATLTAVESTGCDVLFLDIRMPGGDGLQVARALRGVDGPMIVFVTAYDEHAVAAFEADAVDYLLKPIEPTRLAETIERIRRRAGKRADPELGARIERAIARIADGARTAPERIAVEDDGRYRFVEPRQVSHATSAGNYVELHWNGRIDRVRGTVDEIHERLGPRFIKVGRATLVNLDQVESAEHFVKGSYVLFLRGGAKVRTSRGYRDGLDRLLGASPKPPND